MFRSFTVRNFRCFRELTLAPLERINLIAGKNNSGKTALLEAIHLHCHPDDCTLPVDINKERGIEEPATDLGGVGAWLLHNYSTSEDFELTSQDQDGVERSLKVRLTDGQDAREMLSERERAQIATDAPYLLTRHPCLVLSYQKGAEGWVHSIGAPVHIGIGIASISARAALPIPCRFLTASTSDIDRDIESFGSLEAAKRQGEILPALQILEPRLQRLYLVPFAGKPVIHGDIGLPRLVPLPLMGEGIRRVLSIVLAIANAPGGVVLIDEVENGLHYSVLRDVWRAIAEAACRADVQIFATTHSYECIQAASQAFQTQETVGLRHFRLDWIQDELRVAVYTQEILNFAIEMTHEVR